MAARSPGYAKPPENIGSIMIKAVAKTLAFLFSVTVPVSGALDYGDCAAKWVDKMA